MRLEVAPGLFIEPDAETLREREELLAANPLFGYFPYPFQALYHAARTPIAALIAANQVGKTHSSLADDLIQLLPAEVLPEWLRPYKHWHGPVIVWIGVPKEAKIYDTQLPKLRELTPKSCLVGGSLDGAFSKQHKTINFTNGSQIVFKTYDQDVNAYSGASIHRMHWDEEPEGDHGVEIRNEARIRLLKHNGEERISMTPLLGFSWVYEAVYERRLDPDVTVVGATWDDVPHLGEDAKKQMLMDVTDEQRQARSRGEFVHFGGTFYPTFNDRKHVRPPITKDHLRGQDVVVGIDPGLRHTGIVWIAFDNDNSALVFDEFYPGEGIVPDFAAEIKRRNAKWGVKPRYVIDPSARNRNAINADQIEAAYSREGVHCEHGQNDRGSGILEVQRRLAQGTLVLTEDCKDTIRQFPRYRRDPNVNDEWAAIKTDDDLLDALRYGLMSRVWVQPSTPAKKRRPTFGERPDLEPPFDPRSFPKPDPSPMGSYT